MGSSSNGKNGHNGTQPNSKTRDREANVNGTVIKYDEAGWPLSFRPAGSKAGTWPHVTWWHSALCDPYERINVISHSLPALIFFVFGLFKLFTGQAKWHGVVLFSFGSSVMHACSALTHVFPDDLYLEKLDHLGIAMLLMTTPISTIVVRFPEEPLGFLYAAAVIAAVAAFFPPLWRVLSFACVVIYIYGFHTDKLYSPYAIYEVGLYAVAALTFLRNGGHERLCGFQDHHILHYASTSACFIHLVHLYDEVLARSAAT